MVIVCRYVPAGVPGGIPSPKYMELLVTALLGVGAGITMLVSLAAPVSRAAVPNDVPEAADHVVLLTSKFAGPIQFPPYTNSCAATFPPLSISFTPTLVGTFAEGVKVPKSMEFGLSDI
jgi:hypothetical protein